MLVAAIDTTLSGLDYLILFVICLFAVLIGKRI